MPYVFRKYSGYNPNDIRCWTRSGAISPENFVIEDIVYSKGSSKAGTSIPSPLARMELFDTAFQIVATDKKNNLEGNTIYHQLVSDCLDVLQLLFNTLGTEIGEGKKIRFREWKVRENIDHLKVRGESHPHYILGKSLEQIFFDSAGSSFTGLDSIFLIYYDNKLLGGTSPLTLAFTSPNWARYIADGQVTNVPQSMDGDIFFDNNYRPLHKRDKNFVEYLYKLLLVHRPAFMRAEGLRKYINSTVTLYFPELKYSLENYLAEAMDADYTRIKTNVENKYLTINGLFFYHQREGIEKDRIAAQSDFVIRATQEKYKKQYNHNNEEQFIYPPLVLLNGMNIPGDYMEQNVPWNPNTIIQDFYHRNIPLYERKLPLGNSQSVTYPFLTTEDFLEDILLEMPYAIDKRRFFTGFAGNCNYLLPVKKEYFNFFSFRDLQQNLTIAQSNGIVIVSLKVPIRNKKGIPHIVFSKQYKESEGTIIKCRAGIGIYPFFQVTGDEPALQQFNDYTILLANREETELKDERIALKFFNYTKFASDSDSIAKQMISRSETGKGGAMAISRFYKFRELFDYMELSYRYDQVRRCSGLVIPDFENRRFHSGNLQKAYTFAIDFGTSNTHVAFKEQNEALPSPFVIEEADQQMVLLNAPAYDETDLGIKYTSYGQFPDIDLVLRREFIPAIITNKSKIAVSFPFKTASCEVMEFKTTERTKLGLFSHINIGYYIDKDNREGNIAYTTNLKWLLENNNDEANISRVKFFLKQLLLQIRTKAILSGCRPADLKIVWSVPSSMGLGSIAKLKKIMAEAFKEIFDGSGVVLAEPIRESIAPYFYLTRSDTGIQDISNVINIDIGGGTTDIMMFMESAGNRPDKFLTTSFRFAGNDIWGSGFKTKLKDNGFIKNYLAYKDANTINAPEETGYFKSVMNDAHLNADDVVSLLFRYDDSLRFSYSITNGKPELTLVLFLHYSAIIYHIVQIIELRQYPLPRYLSFTGKGSQYIKLLCDGDGGALLELTRKLIHAYTHQQLQSSFSIHLNENPKEITANGAVMYSLAERHEKEKYDSSIQYVHAGHDPAAMPAAKAETIVAEIKDINSPANIAVLNNLNSFLEKTLNNRDIINFLAQFNVTKCAEALNALKWDGNIDNGEGLVYDSYRKVLNNLCAISKDEDNIPESLFFFGLKESLYLLSKQIISNKY